MKIILSASKIHTVTTP